MTCGLPGKGWSFLGRLAASTGATVERWKVLDGPTLLESKEHGGPWSLRSVHPERCPSMLLASPDPGP